jgi:hypothetical protein
VDLDGWNLIHFVLVHLQLNGVGVDLEADLHDLAVQSASVFWKRWALFFCAGELESREFPNAHFVLGSVSWI